MFVGIKILQCSLSAWSFVWSSVKSGNSFLWSHFVFSSLLICVSLCVHAESGKQQHLTSVCVCMDVIGPLPWPAGCLPSSESSSLSWVCMIQAFRSGEERTLRSHIRYKRVNTIWQLNMKWLSEASLCAKWFMELSYLTYLASGWMYLEQIQYSSQLCGDF